jgi:hypothetical protein
MTLPAPQAARRSAFTLMEVVISLGLATMFVLGVIVFSTLTFQQGVFALGNYTDLNTKSRHTLDQLSKDIRNASQLTAFATNSITLTNLDTTRFSYTWDGSNLLVRTYAGVSTVMLTNCDYLSFNIYQRNPTNGYSFFSSTGNVAQTKLIDVSWRCSRNYLGAKLNTESVQTARIVIRN